VKRIRLEKVKAEMKRLQVTISNLEGQFGEKKPDSYTYSYPRETGAIKRASMDLTRALSDLRKSDYEKLPGEK